MSSSTVARVRRLSRPRVRPRPTDVALVGAGLGVALAEALFVAVLPAVCAAGMRACVARLA